jgi:hypothetical protein
MHVHIQIVCYTHVQSISHTPQRWTMSICCYTLHIDLEHYVSKYLLLGSNC